MLIYDGTAFLSNNTISQNQCYNTLTSQGAGITQSVFGFATGANNIIYGNTALIFPDILGAPTFTYSCCSQTLPGTGNITSNPIFVSGPQGDFYLSQVAAGQSTTSPCVNRGDPASSMLTGTTRTDEVQDAGVIDMGFHYSFTALPPVAITLAPVNPPIVIPATGGSFNYNATLQNTTTTPQTTFAWIKIRLPNGAYYGPVLGPLPLTLPASASLTRLRTQAIPASAPPGTYAYVGYVGPNSSTISDSSFFNFTKLGISDLGLRQKAATSWGSGEWTNTGEPFPSEMAEIRHSSFVIRNLEISPNPFNPTTVASYELRAASFVSLRVYDAAGRLVATLVEGWREVGGYQATFDGSKLPSGIYFARLTTGDFVQTQKLVLMK